MINLLAALFTDMKFELVAFEPELIGNFLGVPDEVSHQSLIFFLHGHDRVNMSARNDQNMMLRLGVDVVETHRLRAFIDHLRREFFADNSAENTGVHEDA